MLTINYTYRLYPTADQQALMLEWLETCRRLYNHCLRDLKDWINSRKCNVFSCSLNREYIMSLGLPFPSYLEQKRQLTQWKKINPWYKSVHSQVTQDVVKRMHNTWEAFKARGFGFPRYKKYGQYRSFLFPQFKTNPIEGNNIKLPTFGQVPINVHRPIPEGFKIKGVRIVSRARATIWYAVVTISCDVNVPDPIPSGNGLGIDIGLHTYLVASNNFRVRPARFFRDLQSQLKSLQRKASRKQKKSKNWEKAQLKVARLHHKISNSRKNFHLETSHQLCDQADMIFVEDIDFRIGAKGFLGKHMLDGGFGQFRQLLSWVCWKRGRYFSEVDHKFTSQICPKCSTHTGKKELSQRLHVCPVCNYQTTRDHASSEVILNRGLEMIVPTDCRERKLSGNGVLSGVKYLDKCRSRNTNSRELEAYTVFSRT